MGFLVAFNRKMYLINHKHRLESKITDITAKQMQLTDTLSQLTSQINDFGDTESPAVKQLQARKVEIEALDKRLSVEMEKIQTQLQAANTELQSCDGMVQQNVQRAFSYNVGG